MKISHVPTRLATGAFILNSGLSKLGSDDDDMAKSLHGMASGTYPMLAGMEPRVFAKVLGASECVVGGVLLAPFVPSWLAGTALTGFSAGLVRMYLKTPGLRREDGVRPSPQGVPLAKDSWMLGIGLSLVLDSIGSRRAQKRAARHAARQARRAQAKRDAARALRHHRERA